MKTTDLERSTYQNSPAYRYIRQSDKLPSTSSDGTPSIAKVRIFDPTGSWTWYLAEYDPETRTAYGLVKGAEAEYGSIDMAELVAYRGRFGLPLERDLHFSPAPLEQIYQHESR